MATINQKARVRRVTTHEGAPAYPHLKPIQELRRSVLSCLLWEDTFYESGIEISERISTLAQECKSQDVAALAQEARTKYHLRHAPLWLSMGMRGPLLKQTLLEIIKRPDEITQWLALYWKEGKRPLPASAKKALACAFNTFDAYQLAKYRADDKQVKLVDALKLVHPKPKDAKQSKIFKSLLEGTLKNTRTWEARLSKAGQEAETEEGKTTLKRDAFEELLEGNKMGGMAILRNLRNFTQNGVSKIKVRSAMKKADFSQVLPFRFLTALDAAPEYLEDIEAAMFRTLAERSKIPGVTAVLVDVSGSMGGPLSAKSATSRMFTATALAILCRELCEEAPVYSFSSKIVQIPSFRGMALAGAISNSQDHGSTYGGAAVEAVNRIKPDRLIVITDEQFHDRCPAPSGKGYMINVASNRNGVGYGPWTHIDGFSEAVLEYIKEVEA